MADEVKYLVGGEIAEVKPLPPFDEVVCNFLAEVSEEIFRDKECKPYSDITAVAFWFRRGNVMRLKKHRADDFIRLGRGIAFHITPSNIPVQFIFSYAFGLLSGNANIVRVTSKEFPQIDLLCNVLNRVLSREEFSAVRKLTGIVRYGRESGMTAEYSAKCNVRLIWGGDETIADIRKNPLPPRGIDITFADRYSIAFLNSDAVLRASDAELNRLAKNFYNDTFLMDQNACSSPQLILWSKDGSEDSAKEKFWGAVERIVRDQYDLTASAASEKYTDFCRNAIRFADSGELIRHDNYIYRAKVRQLFEGIENLRGKFGLFYEFDINDLSELDGVVSEKFQTLTYFGFEPRGLASTVAENSWLGIDRIVPIGKALDLIDIWDGFDLINQMSRIIYFE